MANVSSPFGAEDFMHQGGSQRTEELTTAWVMSSDAVPIFLGDLVTQISPVSTALTSVGYGMYIGQGCSATTNWVGVFRGCKYYSAAAGRVVDLRYWPGSGATGDVKCYINADPSYRFVIQGSTGGIIGSLGINCGYNVAVGWVVSAVSSSGGNTTTGQSGMQLASSVAGVVIAKSTAAASLTQYPFRLVDFYSNWAAGANPTQPGTGSSLAFVNGVDNTSAAQWLIVEPLDWVSKAF